MRAIKPGTIRAIRKGANFVVVFGLMLAFSKSALAQEAEAVASPVDTVWVLICAALVFFMQAGFGFLEAGLVRSKNVVNIMAENFMDTTMSTLAFVIAGFGLMFSAGNNFFGTEWFFLRDLPELYPGLTIPSLAFFFFQFAFCAAAGTIASGLMAERTDFKADLVDSFFVALMVYPIFGQWVWGGGWLAGLGFLDFAGSTVVHAVGGFAALGAVLVLGPRIGRYVGGKPVAMPGHNMTFAALGVFILWLGWYGFNAGSTMGIAGDPGLVAHIVLTTTLAAAAGGATALAASWARHRKPDFSLTVNGILAGLVAITAPTAFVGPAAAIAIGAAGGALVVGGIVALDRLRLDDPVGAIAVHGVVGVWGTLAVGIFGLPDLGANGLLATGSASLLGVQAIGTLSVSAVALLGSYGLWRALDALFGARVAPREELVGLDVSEHGAEAYVPADTLRDPIFVGAGD